MKVTQLASGAALVASVVSSPPRVSLHHDSPPIPLDGLKQQGPFPTNELHHNQGYFHDEESSSHSENWWDTILTSLSGGIPDYFRTSLDTAFDTVEDIQDRLRGHLTEAINALPTVHRAQVNGGYHDFPDLTIYQLISISNYTTKFHELVSEYPDIVDTLNSTRANYTLFVPIDSAFDKIPSHHHDKGKDGSKKPSREFIESVLKYHIGLDAYNARRILTTHTLPTALNEKLLGSEPQRLRTRVGLGGVRINFYSKVVAADIVSTPTSLLILPYFILVVLSLLFPASLVAC